MPYRPNIYPLDYYATGGGGGSIGGSIATNQVAVGSGSNTIAGSSGLTFDGTIFQIGNVTTPGALLDFGVSYTTAVALSTSGVVLRSRGSITVTDGIGTGTIVTGVLNSITGATAPIIAATNPVTYTNAVSLYVGAAPIAGTNVTITNSYALAVGSGNVILMNGTMNVTSSSATALVVGQNGVTNPALVVNASPATAATGIMITSNPALGGTYLEAISSGTNETLTLASKGSGSILLRTAGASSGTTRLAVSGSSTAFTNTTASSSAVTPRFSVVDSPDASLSAGVEAVHTTWNLAASIRTHATGALTLQRDFVLSGSTHAFVGASALTDMAAFSVVLGSAGTNATVTNVHGILIQTQALTGTITNSFGATFTAATGASNNYSAQFIGDAFLTSSTATSFSVGPNGVTNPVFQVNSSVASAATGVQVIGQASGTNPSIQTISPNANEGLSISTKGTSSLSLQIGGSARLNVSNATVALTPGASNTATAVRFSVFNATDVSLTASTEASFAYFNLGNTARNHATGAITLQRDFRITGSTHTFTASSAVTDLVGVSIDSPTLGTNATGTNVHAVNITSSAVGLATNSYGLTVNAQTGATNNYAAQFLNGLTTFNGIAFNARTVTTTATALATDDSIYADGTGGAFTLTLPTTGIPAGKRYYVIRINGSVNAITIGATVNGAANPTLATQYAKGVYEFNGTNYYQVS